MNSNANANFNNSSPVSPDQPMYNVEHSQDTRNVEDRFKGLSEAEIINILDDQGVELEIAVENTLRDFNMGTIVRTANAFGVRSVHVIGRRQWNKRGAMKTDAYMHIHYHKTAKEFSSVMRSRGMSIVAVDNIEHSSSLKKTELPLRCVLVFGQEGPGLSQDLIDIAQGVVAIEQLGSTRSLNVGSAAAIVMYAWLSRHRLP